MSDINRVCLIGNVGKDPEYNNICGHRLEFGIGDIAKGFEMADEIVEVEVKQKLS